MKQTCLAGHNRGLAGQVSFSMIFWAMAAGEMVIAANIN